MIEVHVSGMTCDHCEHAVRQELERIEGIGAVTIDLVPGGVSTVRCETNAPLTALHEAIAEAGYDIVD